MFIPLIVIILNNIIYQVNGVLEKVVSALQEIFEVVANTEVRIKNPKHHKSQASPSLSEMFRPQSQSHSPYYGSI